MRRGALAASSFPALALLYATLFAAFGTVTPFMPSLLAGRGLAPRDIATVFAAGTLVRIATAPLLGALADRFGARAILALCAFGAGTVGLLYLPAEGLAALVAVSMLHAVPIAGLNPLADALALAGGVRERCYGYGAVRGIGSAAFVMATLCSGLLVTRAGLSSIVTISSALFLLMLSAIPRLPSLADGAAEPVVVDDEARSALGGRLGGPLASGPFRAALAVAAMVIGSQSMSDTFAVIHWRAAGLAPSTISILLAEAVCSEIVVFLLVGPLLVRRLGAAGCATLSAAAGVLRWSVFAGTTAVAALSLSELLQGLTFALMQLSVMAVIAGTVPLRHAATAQTLYGTLSLGLASAAVTAASGWAYAELGDRAFLLMAGLCALALPLAPLMRMRASDAAPDG